MTLADVRAAIDKCRDQAEAGQPKDSKRIKDELYVDFVVWVVNGGCREDSFTLKKIAREVRKIEDIEIPGGGEPNG